jgi:hypothetical protein
MSGPYDLSHTTIQNTMSGNKPSKWTSTYATYLILSMNKIYHFKSSLNDIFNSEYAESVETLFSGDYDYDDIVIELPKDARKMLKKSYLQELSENKTNSFQQALEKNDVYQWTPKAPVQLCGAKGDLDVPFQNSVVTYDYMKAQGTQISLINVGDDKDHATAFEPCLKATFIFFETIRAQLHSSN